MNRFVLIGLCLFFCCQISEVAAAPHCETTFEAEGGIKCKAHGGCKRCIIDVEAAKAHEQALANASPNGAVPTPSPLICVCDPGYDKNCNLVKDPDAESNGFKCEGTCKNAQNKCSMVIHQNPMTEENSLECRCLAGTSTEGNKTTF